MLCTLLSTAILLLVPGIQGSFLDFEVLGAIPNDSTTETAIFNGKLLNSTWNNLQSGDTFFVQNKTYTVMGGIKINGWKNIKIQIDGTLSFSNDRDAWPRQLNGDVEECMYLSNIENVTFTSGGKGIFDGQGEFYFFACKSESVYFISLQHRQRMVGSY